MTSILVITAKAWTTKPPKMGTDVSTSTAGLVGGDTACLFKPATLSFRDERARWEWPRRTVPAWGILEG